MFQPTGNPTPKVGFCKMGLALSPDGRCKTFDESANGFTRADGAGSIVLELAGEAQKAAWGVGRAWGGWRWCDWGLGWASELLCQVFPWFHRGFSLTNSLHSWVLGQKKPNLFRKKCRTEIPSIASRQNGKQELAMALGVCVNQVPARKTWVCLKMGYTPNYSHLVGIMIINHWV